MKHLSFLAVFWACGGVHAQQPPALPPTPAVLSPGVSVTRPEYAPPTAPARSAPVAESLAASNDLRDLIRVQTEAISNLAAKVDLLEDRLRRIEGKLR